MYNYQQYVHAQQIKSELKKMKTCQDQIEMERKQKNKQLLYFHSKRIENSINQLSQNPKFINKYKDNVYKPREQNKNKRITHGFMVFNYQNQASRIKKNSREHQKLDLIPSTRINKFRNSYDGESIKTNENTKQNQRRKTNKSLYSTSAKTNCSFNELYFPMIQNIPKDQKLYLHSYETVVNAPDLGLKTVKDYGCSKSKPNIYGKQRHLLEGLKQNNVKIDINNRKIQIINQCKTVLKKCGIISPKYKFQTISNLK